MAHELSTFLDGRARLAYVGATPWHGLGQQLSAGSPLEVWAKESGMDFNILSAPIKFTTQDGKTYPCDDKVVLYRDDNHEKLSIVSPRYQVVQPIEVLEFFRELTAEHGFELETAGVLFNGSKYWALARTGNSAKLPGGDELREFVMLATSCDGTLRTTAKDVATRVVCNNTITMALGETNKAIKVSHASKFDAEKVQGELLGIGANWKSHVEMVKALAATKITEEQAVDFAIGILGDHELGGLEHQKQKTGLSKVLQLFTGQGLGAEMKSTKDTAWGLVNAFTELGAWHQGKDQSRRLESNWFYNGDKLNQQVFQQAYDKLVLAA